MTALAVQSGAGRMIMEKSRLLEGGEGNNHENGQQNKNENAQQEVQMDVTWMKDFSIKFLGCHHVASWNSNVDEDSDVRIKKQRFVRFRLCPSSSCSSKASLGCSGGFGDYIVDMDTFVGAHVESQMNQVDQYSNNYQNLLFLSQYSQCSQMEDKYHRHLKENNVAYYIGSYCSGKGENIHLGLFTDDTCTEFADSNSGNSVFQSLTGGILPYSKADSKSVVDRSCYSCLQNYANGQAAIDESCQNLYSPSGKCEKRISKYVSDPNNNGCTYIDGIRFTPLLSSGVLYRNRYGWVMSLFLSFFVISFVAVLCYIVYLKLELAKQKRTWRSERRSSPIKNRRRSRSRSTSRDRMSRSPKEDEKSTRRFGRGFFGRKRKETKRQSLLS